MWKGSFSTCSITLKVWDKSPWSNLNVLFPTHNTKQHWLEKRVCGTRQERPWSNIYIMYEFYFHSYIYEQKTCVQDYGYEMMIGSCVFFAIESSIFFTFLHGFIIQKESHGFRFKTPIWSQWTIGFSWIFLIFHVCKIN